MTTLNPIHGRDLLDVWHANLLSTEDLAETFVPTEDLWQLTAPKNHIIYGSRGSGKTAITRMLSHDHMALLQNREDRAKTLIESKQFIGIYLATRVDWVGALRSRPGVDEAEAATRFQWGLNVGVCQAFLDSLRSCLLAYIPDIEQRARTEYDLAKEIGANWGTSASCASLFDLRRYLTKIIAKRWRMFSIIEAGQESADSILSGTAFDTDLFVPLESMIALAGEALDIPSSAVWAVCIDEAEFLDEMHHRLLNTYLRAHPRSAHGSLVFKIATLPYKHHTLATNREVDLIPGQDFDYLFIDEDPVQWGDMKRVNPEWFAEQLLQRRLKRMGYSAEHITLKDLLGSSELLAGENTQGSEAETVEYLEHAGLTEQTLERAKRLLLEDPVKYGSQIGRKIRGLIYLREKARGTSGNKPIEVYSGEGVIARCSDMHPRRLLHVFRDLLRKVDVAAIADGKVKTRPMINRTLQSRVVQEVSRFYYETALSEGSVGPQLHELIGEVATRMKVELHEDDISTDIVSSIDFHDCTSNDWKIAKTGVMLALLMPAVNRDSPNPLPVKNGVFHLAYMLSPVFWLYPRRGEARTLGYFSRPRLRGQMDLFEEAGDQ